jgi:16S rRNA (adenine1518-N6/adenine1519-N6)-dimethyltransferase
VAVVGSIPYSITAPILQKLVEARASIRVAFLITQREVADKILASPGPAGTSLGTLVRAYAEVEIVRRVPRGSFHPVPAVDSTLWKLAMRDEPRFASPPEMFFAVVRAIYGARRKTLRNALQRAFACDDVAAWLARAGLEGGVRGETLDFEALDRLAAAAPDAGAT